MEGARLPPLSQMGDDGRWCFTGLHRHHQAASYTPDDDARPRTSNPKPQMSCPRKGTSSHIPLHKTWKQTQKKNPKPGHKSRLEPPPTPSNPPINQPQKDGAGSSVAPPSPQLDIVSCSDLQRAGLGRPVPGSRQTGPQPTAHPWGAEGPGVLRSNQTHQRVLLVRIGWGVWF